jgi:hypothetical protein
MRARTLCRIGVLLGSVAALSGCGSARPGDVIQRGPDEFPIQWEEGGTYSNIARAFRVVARDRATLSQLPIAEVPVDFDRQMVLVAALGPASTDQLAIRITRVWRDGSRIRVQVQTLHPGEEKRGGVRRASPYHIVVVPRSDLGVAGFATAVPPGAFDMASTPGTPPPPGALRRRR